MVQQGEWIVDVLMSSIATTPEDLLEEVIADSRCPDFGPIYHFIVGAVLLACWRNAESSPDRDEALAADLEEMISRSGSVPGATCARWGVCGAAASAGMALAIARRSAPLRDEGWREGQLMVSELLERIALSGSPRCCKRDARVAVRYAVSHFNAGGGAQLAEREDTPVCSSSSANSVCVGEGCLFYPRDPSV